MLRYYKYRLHSGFFVALTNKHFPFIVSSVFLIFLYLRLSCLSSQHFPLGLNRFEYLFVQLSFLLFYLLLASRIYFSIHKIYK